MSSRKRECTSPRETYDNEIYFKETILQISR